MVASGPATPSMAPRPNRSGCARHSLFHRVRDDRGQDGADAGDQAQHDADHRAPRDRHGGIRRVLAGQAGGVNPLGHDRNAPCASRLARISPMPYSPMMTGTKLTPSSSSATAERQPRGALDEIGAGHRQREAEQCAEEPGHGASPPARPTTRVRPSTIRPKNSGGPKESATRASGGAATTSTTVATVPPMNEPMAAMRERRPRPPLPGHLVAVDRGDRGGGLAGDAHQHGGDRAAVHGAVVDRRQHDDGAGRVEAEGQRQEDRDPGDRADAGQDADRGADDAADEREQQVRRPEGHARTPRPGSRRRPSCACAAARGRATPTS